MKTSHINLLAVFAAILLPLAGFAQVNSGSNGSDGAFNPTASVVINMADHPDGIYHYTSVNIPAGVTVSFIPNAGNKPVVWLVQGDCVVVGGVALNGGSTSATDGVGAIGGAGGFRGGNGGTLSTAGLGPGGGPSGVASTGTMQGSIGGNASYATLGASGTFSNIAVQAGTIYGNKFLIPLMGGSGGGGAGSNQLGPTLASGGGGGGGAVLIVASGKLTISGSISATGGYGGPAWNGSNLRESGGSGSGGGIRLIATQITGTGTLDAHGGSGSWGGNGGMGWIRLDTYQNTFAGSSYGNLSQGFQPIILPISGQGIQLAVANLAGVAVPANPSGVQANPDVIIPAQQNNPIPVVVSCTNVPLNTEISVVVHPVNGPDVQAVGLNNAGTLAASTATLSLNMPRGGGIIYAKAVTGIAGGGASIGNPADAKTRSLAETGWTAEGERFVQMEITAALGGAQRVTYITASGKRYPAN